MLGFIKKIDSRYGIQPHLRFSVREPELRNLEFKAEVREQEELQRAFIENGARYVATLNQRDTYFNVVEGRLKLRETEEKKPELIFYRRNESSSSGMESNYSIFPVEDLSLKEFLSGSLGVKVVVEKKRLLLMLRNARLHLDEVVGLGRFLEFEVVSAEATEAGRKADAALLDRLKGYAGPFVVREINESYCDLMLRG